MLNIFDNSTGHAAYSPDALRAQNVAAGAGGQQAVPRPFVHEGRRIPTVFEEDSVLLFDTNPTSKKAEEGDGSECGREGGEDTEPDRQGEGDTRRCCLRFVLSNLPAFKEQKNRVEEILEAAGHRCILLPKYHPECNAIERVWGHSKAIGRRVCDYSVKSRLKRLPATLSSMSLSLIRKWARISWLFVEAYATGLDDYMQYRDLKKWTSHRSSTDRV
ncbi:unnamed protein product, partial [Pylaiella littoralis]